MFILVSVQCLIWVKTLCPPIVNEVLKVEWKQMGHSSSAWKVFTQQKHNYQNEKQLIEWEKIFADNIS